MNDLKTWVRGAVQSVFELKPLRNVPITQEFVVDYLFMVTLGVGNEYWSGLLHSDQKKLVNRELVRLEKEGIIETVEVPKVISKEKFYQLR